MSTYERNTKAIRLFVMLLLVTFAYSVWAGGKLEETLTNKFEKIYIGKYTKVPMDR